MLLTPQYTENLVALVIDEAHCIKTWGDEFRTTFSKIGSVRSLMPIEVKVMALTATATCETLNVVIQRLSMENPTLISMPPNRDNIVYRVDSKTDIDCLTTSICSELTAKGDTFPKTVIHHLLMLFM